MTQGGEQAKALKNQMLEFLGLNQDPFEIEPQTIYLGPMRQHYLESLRHLSIFGDMVLLLVGERGAGKTTLLRRFVEEQSAELHVLSVTAGGQFSGQGVLDRLANLAGLSLAGAESEHQRVLQLIQKLQKDHERTQRRALLVVDDADQLPKPELYALLEVFRAQSEEAPVVLLLAGAPSLEAIVAEMADSGRDEWFHVLPLRPFDRDEALRYLQFRLEAAGYAGQLTLTEQQAAILAEGGKGLPGRIHRVFPAVLMGAQVFSSGRKQKIVWPAASKAMAGVVVLLLMSFVFVGRQHGLFDAGPEESLSVPSLNPDEEVKQHAERLARIEAAIASQEVVSEMLPGESHENGGTLVAPEAVPVIESVEEESEREAVEQEVAVADELSFEGAEETEKRADKQAFSPREEDGNDRTEAEDVAELIVGQQGDSAAEPLEQKAASVQVRTASDGGSGTEDEYRSRSWVEAQSPGHYTIQVLGSYNRDTATKFIATAARRGTSLYYLETRYKGRPWYVVFYGLYANKAEARAGLDTAPVWLKQQKPWLRSFAGVQSSLSP